MDFKTERLSWAKLMDSVWSHGSIWKKAEEIVRALLGGEVKVWEGPSYHCWCWMWRKEALSQGRMTPQWWPVRKGGPPSYRWMPPTTRIKWVWKQIIFQSLWIRAYAGWHWFLALWDLEQSKPLNLWDFLTWEKADDKSVFEASKFVTAATNVHAN